MQWTNETNAGFTNHSDSWIQVPSDANDYPWNVNVRLNQILLISVTETVNRVKMAAASECKELIRMTATDVLHTNSLTGT